MGKKPRNASQMAMMRNAKKQKVSKSPHVAYPTESQVEAMTGIRMPKNTSFVKAEELFGEEMNSSSFTYDKYCGKVGISTADIFGSKAEISEKFSALGWTPASKLAVRPRTDGVAIMLWSKEFEEETWCHVSESFLDTMYLANSCKTRRK